MAGLYGFFVRSRRSPEWIADRLAHMSRGVVRRPFHRSHHVTFAHAAIGISGPDLLAGCLQTHVHPSGAAMVAEGEVYRGIPWAEVLDTWCRGGAGALAGLDGLYNLVRYDQVEGPALRILSDRYGSRRLFVHDDGDACVFAADFAAVLAWMGPAAAIDRRFVEETICLGSPLRGGTWVDGIRLFEPATEWCVSAAGVSARRYWDWSRLPAPGSLRPRDPAAEAYERWREVIEVRLAGDGVGQQLSGGLDSRLILAEASRHRTPWPTLTYGTAGSDEVRFAARAARQAGSPWTLLDLPGPDWIARRVELSLENGGFLPLLNAHPAGRLADIARVFRFEMSGFAGDVTMGETYRGLDAFGVMSKLPYWSSPVSLDPAEAFRRVTDDLGTASTWGYVMDTKMRRTINGWPHLAPPDLEVRKPFLDYRFLEFCAGLPDEYRRGSRLHVEILRRYFPALARLPVQQTGVRPGAPRALRYAMAGVRRVHRLAQAAGLPVAPWIRGAFDVSTWLADPAVERTLGDALLAPDARVRDYFDTGAVQKVLEQTFRSGGIAHEIAFNLLRVEHVLRRMPEWMRPERA